MIFLRYVLIAVMSVFLLTAAAMAAPADVGTKIPHTLATVDQNGEAQSFEKLKGERGAVIYFVRSADWCPYCQVQLLDIRDYGAQIEEAGYSIITVSYDAPDKLKAFSDKYKFEYTMLSDQNSEAIKAFGILNEEMEPGTPYYGIPYPTIYVVNADGTIKAKLAEDGYKERPKAEVVLEAIK